MSESTVVNQWTPDQLKFQAWLALPSGARSPRSQQALAKTLGVSEETLCRWKRTVGWHEAVYALAMSDVLGELVPVLHAQIREAKKGSLAHAQWVFEVAGKWTPTTRQQHTGKDGGPIEIQPSEKLFSTVVEAAERAAMEAIAVQRRHDEHGDG
jgi:hypothetical protein